MIILDTDILSQLQRNNLQVLQRLEASDEDVFITLITKLEMIRGRIDYVLKASTAQDILFAQELFIQTEVFLSRLPTLTLEDDSLRTFQQLRKAPGYRKMGRADLLIESIAIVNGATLITRNTKDFSKISGLKIENWID
jgi:tRNA(fMet)-specific endonuclease VapC